MLYSAETEYGKKAVPLVDDFAENGEPLDRFPDDGPRERIQWKEDPILPTMLPIRPNQQSQLPQLHRRQEKHFTHSETQ